MDDNLDSIKRTYYGLGDFLVRSANASIRVYKGAHCSVQRPWRWARQFAQSAVAKEVGKTIPPTFAPTLAIVYWPQLGYLIAVPARYMHV